MFSLWKKKPDHEVAVLFDIGNGSIGVALVSFVHSDHPTILYSHREPLTFLQQITPERLVEQMLKLLESVSKHLAKEGLPHIHTAFFGEPVIRHVFCVFSSPWYVSQTKLIKIEQEKEFVVTAKYLDSLISTEEKLFNDALSRGDYEKIFGADITLLERKIIHTRLNGYEMSDPIGKSVRELEVTFFTSLISKEILSKIESTLHKSFHFKSIKYFSYALSSWNAMRTIFPDSNDFLFMDITNEITDITLTSKGVLLETVSFPYGRTLLIRDASKELNVSPEVALSFLSMQAAGTSDKESGDKVKLVAETSGKKWLAELVSSLKDLSKRHTLPKAVFVTVDTDLSSYFLTMLSKELPLELNIPENKFFVNFMNSSKVRNFVDHSPNVTQDPFLGIESIFLNNLV